jgi:hypothetical protein
MFKYKLKTTYNQQATMAAVLNTLNFQQVVVDGQYAGKSFRFTNDTPRRVSVIDWIMMITGKNQIRAGEAIERMLKAHPEVSAKMRKHQFPGRGQRLTPVATASDLLFMIGKLPHKYIADFEKERDTLTARYLGGDTSLSREVAVIRTHQASLPQNHPMRVFGEAVESGQIGHMNENNDEPVYLDARHEARAKAIEGFHEQTEAIQNNPAINNMCAHMRTNAEVSKVVLGIYPRELREQLKLKKGVSSRNYMDEKQLRFVAAISTLSTDIAHVSTSTKQHNEKITKMTGSFFPILKRYKVHGYKNVPSLSRPQLLIEPGEEGEQQSITT